MVCVYCRMKWAKQNSKLKKNYNRPYVRIITGMKQCMPALNRRIQGINITLRIRMKHVKHWNGCCMCIRSLTQTHTLNKPIHTVLIRAPHRKGMKTQVKLNSIDCGEREWKRGERKYKIYDLCNRIDAGCWLLAPTMVMMCTVSCAFMYELMIGIVYIVFNWLHGVHTIRFYEWIVHPCSIRFRRGCRFRAY